MVYQISSADLDDADASAGITTNQNVSSSILHLTPREIRLSDRARSTRFGPYASPDSRQGIVRPLRLECLFF